MSIPNNYLVSINYKVKEYGTDEILDSNLESKPLEFILGADQVIRGLDKEVLNMNVGDHKILIIEPKNAYGLYNDTMLQVLPKDQFSGITLEKNMILFGEGENGESVQVLVKDFNDTEVTIDYNHPLAGKTLEFDVTILSARETTPDDFQVSSGCGCGGHGEDSHHEHKKEGCCGGGGNCHDK